MNVNRSGYYKWSSRKGKQNRYEKDRELLTELLKEAHKAHPSRGYHRLAKDVFRQTGWIFSDNLAHKCCKLGGIHSAARRYTYRKPGAESVKFENVVHGRWNAKRPLDIVVSDMTVLKSKGQLWEWTLMLDTFNNEIIAHSVSSKAGDSRPYYRCLDKLKELVQQKKEQKDPTILHTDQGAVYSSRAFCNAHEDYSIIRSMSRGGTPTDNPIMEAVNGWMKAELSIDFGLATADNMQELLDDYVDYFNTKRHAAALGYKSPVQYRTELGFV